MADGKILLLALVANIAFCVSMYHVPVRGFIANGYIENMWPWKYFRKTMGQMTILNGQSIIYSFERSDDAGWVMSGKMKSVAEVGGEKIGISQVVASGRGNVMAKSLWLVLLVWSKTFFDSLIPKKRKALTSASDQNEAESSANRDVVTTADDESRSNDLEISMMRCKRLEQNLERLGRDLNNTTMSLIHKDELLREISTRIDHVNDLLASGHDRLSARRILVKINQMIESNLGKENNCARLAGNIDMLYADFIKKLMARHPNLSVSDKRLCCYIRMGLSSKEIAPLVNVSYKSVEMARYRVRKKIGLDSGDSLACYLENL